MASTLERIGSKVHPASLGAYYRCPRNFQTRYLRRLRMPFEFKAHLAIGSVTHKALASLFRHELGGFTRSSLESYATPQLLRERYPEKDGDELRAAHLPLVIGHMQRALESLPGNAGVLHVEQEFQRPMRFQSLRESVSIAAKVDLIVKHQDGTIDHIDFKTGRSGGDPIQNVMARVAVAHSLDLTREQLRTVNVMTESGDYHVDASSREQYASGWDVVRFTLASLAADKTWRGTTDPSICHRCEFRTVCDLAAKNPEDYDA